MSDLKEKVLNRLVVVTPPSVRHDAFTAIQDIWPIVEAEIARLEAQLAECYRDGGDVENQIAAKNELAKMLQAEREKSARLEAENAALQREIDRLQNCLYRGEPL